MRQLRSPLKLYGRKVPVAQANNVYVYAFLAVGLAAAACRASRVTDRMMVAAARTVGECALQAGADGVPPLLPPLAGMRDAAREIALAVAMAAVERASHPGRGGRAAPGDRGDAVDTAVRVMSAEPRTSCVGWCLGGSPFAPTGDPSTPLQSLV